MASCGSGPRSGDSRGPCGSDQPCASCRTTALLEDGRLELGIDMLA